MTVGLVVEPVGLAVEPVVGRLIAHLSEPVVAPQMLLVLPLVGL